MQSWHYAALGGVLGAVVGITVAAQHTQKTLETRGAALEASLGQRGTAIGAYLTAQGLGIEAEVRRIGQQHASLVAKKTALELLRVKYHLDPTLGQER